MFKENASGIVQKILGYILKNIGGNMRIRILSLLVLLNINLFSGVFSDIKIDTTTNRIEKRISGTYYFGPSTSTYNIKIDGITGEIKCSTINANIDIGELVIDTFTATNFYGDNVKVNNILILPDGNILSSTKTITDYQPNFALDSDKLDGFDSSYFAIRNDVILSTTSLTNQIFELKISTGNNLQKIFDLQVSIGNLENKKLDKSSATVTYLFKNQKAIDSDKLDNLDSLDFGILKNTQTWTGINNFKNDINLWNNRILNVSSLTFSDGTILTSTTSFENLAGDNLGNHLATQDLDLNNFNIKNLGKILKNETTNYFTLEKNGNYRNFSFNLEGRDYYWNEPVKGKVLIEPFKDTINLNDNAGITLNIYSYGNYPSMIGLFKDTETFVGYLKAKKDFNTEKDSIELGAKNQIILNTNGQKIYIDSQTVNFNNLPLVVKKIIIDEDIQLSNSSIFEEGNNLLIKPKNNQLNLWNGDWSYLYAGSGTFNKGLLVANQSSSTFTGLSSFQDNIDLNNNKILNVKEIHWTDGTIQVSSPSVSAGSFLQYITEYDTGVVISSHTNILGELKVENGKQAIFTGLADFQAGLKTTDIQLLSYEISLGNDIVGNYQYGIGIGAGSSYNYTYGIGIGLGSSYNNFYGVGIGYAAYGNYSEGVGIGSLAINNYTRGVGVGSYANENHEHGVGIGYFANHNNYYGIGIGYFANHNNYYGIGIGYQARDNKNYAIGIGGYSQNNKSYGIGLGWYTYSNSSGVAIGYNAKANAMKSVALGAGCVNNSTETVKIPDGWDFIINNGRILNVKEIHWSDGTVQVSSPTIRYITEYDTGVVISTHTNVLGKLNVKDNFIVENGKQAVFTGFADFQNGIQLGGNIDMQGNIIINVSTNPINSSDVSTKGYTDYAIKNATVTLLSKSSATITYLFKNEKAVDSDKLDGLDSLDFGILKNTQTWTGYNIFENNINLSNRQIINISTLTFSDNTKIITGKRITDENLNQKLDEFIIRGSTTIPSKTTIWINLPINEIVNISLTPYGQSNIANQNEVWVYEVYTTSFSIVNNEKNNVDCFWQAIVK